MGLGEKDYKRSSPEYFTLRFQGIRKAERERFKEDWHRTRWQAYVLIQSQTRKRLSEQDLARFPWERTEAVDWDKISRELPKTIPVGAFDFKRPLNIASFGNKAEEAQA